MNEKSHVSMAVEVCPVCLKESTESVLLHTRLSKVLEPRTFTGWSMCEEHDRLSKEGYVALVEVKDKESKSKLQPSDVTRTGSIGHVRRSAWHKLFNTEISEHDHMVFVEEGFLILLEEKSEHKQMTMKKSLYAIGKGNAVLIDFVADNQTCESCHQAGEPTDSRVWTTGGTTYDISTEQWTTGSSQDLCEGCLCDDSESVFALASNVEDALKLAGLYDAGKIQEDNVIYEGVTVGALSE